MTQSPRAANRFHRQFPRIIFQSRDWKRGVGRQVASFWVSGPTWRHLSSALAGGERHVSSLSNPFHDNSLRLSKWTFQKSETSNQEVKIASNWPVSLVFNISRPEDQFYSFLIIFLTYRSKATLVWLFTGTVEKNSRSSRMNGEAEVMVR